MFLAGGLSDGFFTSPSFALFQPAYPPGAASVVLWYYQLVGTCGEWMIQALPCLLMALIAGYLMTRFGTCLGAMMVFVVFVTPLSIRLATLFYPEVYVAFCFLIGWERIRKERCDFMEWGISRAILWVRSQRKKRGDFMGWGIIGL